MRGTGVAPGTGLVESHRDGVARRNFAGVPASVICGGGVRDRPVVGEIQRGPDGNASPLRRVEVVRHVDCAIKQHATVQVARLADWLTDMYQRTAVPGGGGHWWRR